MADTQTFEWVCDELERSSGLDRLEARGTVRLALKEAGLEARSVTAEQMHVVIAKLLPNELTLRGIENSETIAEALARGLKGADLGGGDSRAPDQVFERLGGG